MTRTQVLQEIRRMRFKEAYGGWRERPSPRIDRSIHLSAPPADCESCEASPAPFVDASCVRLGTSRPHPGLTCSRVLRSHGLAPVCTRLREHRMCSFDTRRIPRARDATRLPRACVSDDCRSAGVARGSGPRTFELRP